MAHAALDARTHHTVSASDGKNYNTKHYNLKAIIAVGYKVNSERAVQFRKWATDIVSEYTIKAYVMDDERLKSRYMLTEQDSCR